MPNTKATGNRIQPTISATGMQAHTKPMMPATRPMMPTMLRSDGAAGAGWTGGCAGGWSGEAGGVRF